MITTYLQAIELLCELIGMHPKKPVYDPEWCEMLRKAGWRPFRVVRIGR